MGKITDEELGQIELIKQQSLEVASILGELTYQKLSLENQIEEQRHKIVEIKKSESELFLQLREKYGNITINIETGEFNQ
jgi:hypothetical protein